MSLTLIIILGIYAFIIFIIAIATMMENDELTLKFKDVNCLYHVLAYVFVGPAQGVIVSLRAIGRVIHQALSCKFKNDEE